jgi:ubiquinone/menaquinone biosynthesis C-methylase UbiE
MSISKRNLDREHFNHWAESYETSFLQRLLFDRVHRAVLEQIPAGFIPTVILDIGCGTGRLLRKLHIVWPNARLIGIDLSEGMVAKAHQLTPFAAIYQAPAENLPLCSDSIDLVTSTVSFHHWINQTQGVREIARVLDQGGIFILADPNIGHGHPMSRAGIRELFLSTNLIIQRQSNIVPFFSITIAEIKPSPIP